MFRKSARSISRTLTSRAHRINFTATKKSSGLAGRGPLPFPRSRLSPGPNKERRFSCCDRRVRGYSASRVAPWPTPTLREVPSTRLTFRSTSLLSQSRQKPPLPEPHSTAPPPSLCLSGLSWPSQCSHYLRLRRARAAETFPRLGCPPKRCCQFLEPAHHLPAKKPLQIRLPLPASGGYFEFSFATPIQSFCSINCCQRFLLRQSRCHSARHRIDNKTIFYLQVSKQVGAATAVPRDS